jgi:acid phosphatase (class A)
VSLMRFCRHLTYFGTVILVALVSLPACAEGLPCPTLDPVLLTKLIMPPPAKDSPETLAELRELQDIDRLRTKDDENYAIADYERTPERFLSAIPIVFTQPPAEALKYLDCIAEQAEHETDEAKTFFNRKRPYDLPDNGLRILKHKNEKDTPSYPSGHATYGMALGLLLAEMLPEKKQEIMNRVQTFGHSRLVSGVHFRSDVYAGQIAGAAIIADFFAHDVDRQQFNKRNDELRKALGFP